MIGCLLEVIMHSRLVALLTLALSLPAFAGDGRLEINQACAVNTGCFLGDLAGFPVTPTSSSPGKSFVLTSDLDLTSQSPATHAIDIVTPLHTENVNFDLAGFEIAGPAVCVGFADGISCSGTGAGNGINGPGASEVVVRNGKIRNMGQHGVLIWGTGRLEDLTVKHNGDSRPISKCVSV
jgi:hypothetical protein